MRRFILFGPETSKGQNPQDTTRQEGRRNKVLNATDQHRRSEWPKIRHKTERHLMRPDQNGKGRHRSMNGNQRQYN